MSTGPLLIGVPVCVSGSDWLLHVIKKMTLINLYWLHSMTIHHISYAYNVIRSVQWMWTIWSPKRHTDPGIHIQPCMCVAPLRSLSSSTKIWWELDCLFRHGGWLRYLDINTGGGGGFYIICVNTWIFLSHVWSSKINSFIDLDLLCITQNILFMVWSKTMHSFREEKNWDYYVRRWLKSFINVRRCFTIFLKDG